MKILVAYKRVIDYRVRVQVNANQTGVITEGVKFSPNPFDEIALEEALRLREAGCANEVIVVSIGPNEVGQCLRTQALAMGADRAIHLFTDRVAQPLTVARALLAIVLCEQPQLVLMGKQAIDDDAGQTGQMLATLWQRPQATCASHVTMTQTKAQVVREIDACQETVEVDLPAVITADLNLNAPRFIKLPNIMKAKSKPIETLALDDLPIEQSDTLHIIQYTTPPQRTPGVRVDNVAALVKQLNRRMSTLNHG